MKLYNRELEEIENQERYVRIESMVQRQIDFLVQKYGIDEGFLQDRFKNLAIVEYSRKSDKGNFKYEFNGEVVEGQASPIFAAFSTSKKIQYGEKSGSLENAVYIDDMSVENEIIHEVFHHLSTDTEVEFDNEGVGVIKSGVRLPGYNRKDEVVDSRMDAEGLNEGVTELLTVQMLDATPRYEYQVYIANILNGNQDNSLIQAYFSKDGKAFEAFLEEFDKRQSSVSSDKLLQLKGGVEEHVDTKLLRGCLEYTLSYCNTMEELVAERKRLIPMFKSMMNNMNLEFDEEQFDIKTFVDGIFNEKRESIKSREQEQTSEQSVLDSAIEATEGTTRVETMNAQAGTLKELAKGKDEQVKGTEKG